jgi:DNA-binding transcriptional regulator YhcF (GntR family)
VTADLLCYRGLIDFNRARREPLYFQIGASIAAAVTEHRIPSGVRVPPVRLLADRLHIAQSTARNVIGYLDEQQCIMRIGARRFLVAPAELRR